MLRISEHYEENVLVGDYKSIKRGITIHSDKELTGEEIANYSSKLGAAAKQMVRTKLALDREEYAKKLIEPEGYQ